MVKHNASTLICTEYHWSIPKGHNSHYDITMHQHRKIFKSLVNTDIRYRPFEVVYFEGVHRNMYFELVLQDV